MTRITGIVLVKNEDRFVRRAVQNILGFCDEILLVDNGSIDGTLGILRQLAADCDKVRFHAISHPSESHDLLKPHAGSDTWVFAVDGDEIYDPRGLENFRRMVLKGDFQTHWMVLGNVLHCDQIDQGKARGWLAPPASCGVPSLPPVFASDSPHGLRRVHALPQVLADVLLDEAGVGVDLLAATPLLLSEGHHATIG